jgi:hypothetical protein
MIPRLIPIVAACVRSLALSLERSVPDHSTIVIDKQAAYDVAPEAVRVSGIVTIHFELACAPVENG